MPVALPVEPRPALLPLGDPGLSWEEFETFCRAYIDAQADVRRVEAYAKHGEPQDGIDLIAFLHSGRTRTYQCRKRKSFARTEAEGVVVGTNKPADEHEILISCEAGKAVRDYIHDLPGWELSDIKDLSLGVRRLDRERARNVVEDAFGIPWRRAFLGPSDALVFVDADRYFVPFERSDTLFRHTWHIVGRERELEALVKAVDDPRIRVVAVVGPGGIGKTRLLRALAERRSSRRVLFALDDGVITASAVETLPLCEATVIADDVHRRHEQLPPLLGEVARREREPLTAVLATRPQRVDELQGSCARAGLRPDEVVILPLHDLDVADVEALAAQAVGPDHAEWAEALARLTVDCPLVTVIGGQLLAQRKIHPALLERDDEFRYVVLERWRDEILGRLSNEIDAGAAAMTLTLVAGLAPLSVEDAPTLELVADEAKLTVPELRGMLGDLRAAGLLAAHGRLRRVVPDVLADHLLHRVCIDRLGAPTGYAEDLYARYGQTALPALLRNLAELDWRITATAGATELLDEVWARIERSFLRRDAVGRVELLERLGPAAELQPARVLEIVRLALAHPAPTSALAAAFDVDLGDGYVRQQLPELVRRAGVSEEHVENALSLLWQLGRDDLRRPSSFLTHPIRAMQEVGQYRGTGRAAETLVDFAERLLAGPEADAPVSPLTLLERLLAREGTALVHEGLGFRPVHYNVSARAVKAVRDRIFTALAQQARHGSRRNRALAAHLLTEALDQPRGAFGERVPPEVFDQWLPEQLHLLELIRRLMTGTTAALVRSRLRTAVQWHAAHSAWPDAKKAALQIVELPEADDEQLMTAIYRPFDFHRDQAHDMVRLESVAQRLAGDSAELADVLDEHLAEVADAGIEANPRPLLMTLAGDAPARIEQLVEAVVAEPARASARYLDTCLSALGRFAPDRLPQIVERLESGPVTLRRAIAGYLSDVDWQQGNRGSEFVLLSRLVTDGDPQVRHSAMHAALRSRAADPCHAAEIALDADLGNDPGLAALMSLTLSESACVVDDAQIDRALTKLLDVDELEHAVIQFLARVGARRPTAVLELLLARLERSGDRSGYEAIPWHPFDADLLAGADDNAYADALRRVRAAALSEETMVRYNAPRLFWHLNRDVDLSLSVLHEWLTCGEAIKVAAAAHLLGGIAPGQRSGHRDQDEGWRELLDRPWFVIDAVERAATEPVEIRKAVRDGLRHVLFSNEVNRTIGEPDERSLATHQAAEHLVSALPAGSAARSFFADLVEHSRESLEEERLEDEEFPHRLR